MSDDATAGMSAERLAEIKRIGYANNHDVIGELLAEVERLRGELAMEIATCKRWLERVVEQGKRADNAVAKREDLADENGRLRTQLAEHTALDWAVERQERQERPGMVLLSTYRTEEAARDDQAEHGGTLMVRDHCGHDRNWRPVEQETPDA